MAKGYNYVCDGCTGEEFAVDRETGERLEYEDKGVRYPKGTKHLTPQQQREIEEKKEKQKKEYLSRYATHDRLARFTEILQQRISES